ncbi:MAG: hypothetical protein LN560_06810 [Rickettsia endosymbiont of Sceptobius lativentris]|nr:hypothetical protein [Rickettsia endosymbiont of Sceptobius lativentris]
MVNTETPHLTVDQTFNQINNDHEAQLNNDYEAQQTKLAGKGANKKGGCEIM